MSGVIFKKIRWRNFLSTGDEFTEINLEGSTKTLIVGDNGSGKSTLLDALNYVLFNKPHRNINKPQLVNSINEKRMLVEIEFIIGRQKYLIRRGQKPSVFEIYCNDELINQDSSSRDYQSYLEQSILKLNYKSFNQVVVLGSSSFVPFMQLPVGQRREIIENLLDINIFTKMNQILRDQQVALKDYYSRILNEAEVTREKIKVQKKYISDIENMNKDLIEEKSREIDKSFDEYDKYEMKSKKLEKKISVAMNEYNSRMNSARNKLKAEEQKMTRVHNEIKNAKKAIQFFQSNDECPVCTQTVTSELSEEQIEKHTCIIDNMNDENTQIQDSMNKVSKRISDLDEIYEKINEQKKILNGYNEEMRILSRRINSLNQDIANLHERSTDIEGAESDLKQYELNLDQAQNTIDDLNEQMNYNTMKFEMLKDTGIKTKIIRKYHPIINKLVNEYLEILDFFVQFTLDENFKEIIKSRHRDIFSYTSFSEGEKSRIDLALLFTWRQIAAMKNSMKTNLLILDETFDSSLDTDGVDNLLKILDTLESDISVFVISHKKDLLDSKFENKLTFKKINNFSICRET